MFNCPIIQQTADGGIVRRCWHYLPDGKTCPIHGAVVREVNIYKNYHQKLTLENDYRKYRGLSLLGKKHD